MNLKFYKIREGAKIPKRAHPSDAGMDLFYCPDLLQNDTCIWEPGHKFKIPAGENCLIPTGIKVDLPSGYMLEVKNKSGIAAKNTDPADKKTHRGLGGFGSTGEF
mgnify:CR=1 FL=1